MTYSFELAEHYSCCGIEHLCSFDPDDDSMDYSSIATALAVMGDNRLAEITLTDGQMVAMPDLVRDMAAAGFVLVDRFRNSNSGNIVNVFHHVPVRELLSGAPGWRGVAHPDPIEAPLPLAPQPAIVHSTFHNVYPRSGRSDCGWPSRHSADEHRGRAVRVDRCDIYSDGTMTWTEEN